MQSLELRTNGTMHKSNDSVFIDISKRQANHDSGCHLESPAGEQGRRTPSPTFGSEKDSPILEGRPSFTPTDCSEGSLSPKPLRVNLHSLHEVRERRPSLGSASSASSGSQELPSVVHRVSSGSTEIPSVVQCDPKSSERSFSKDSDNRGIGGRAWLSSPSSSNILPEESSSPVALRSKSFERRPSLASLGSQDSFSPVALRLNKPTAQRRPSLASLGSQESSSPVDLRSKSFERRPSLASLGSQDSSSPVALRLNKPTAQRRPSLASLGSCKSLGSSIFPHDRQQSGRSRRPSVEAIKKVAKAQTQVKDNSAIYSVAIIISAVVVAACCGVGAFALHLSVLFSGCLGGVNGCNKSLLLDILEPLGISKSLYFIISSCLSGLVCSCIMYSPWKGRVARNCVGGGAAGTKIAISAGEPLSVWVVILRIALAGLYLGGGNPLGTEGPVIHLGTALATCMTSLSGTKSRKLVSLFGVIGASAGISAGFNVLMTGFIYTTEEVTRTISRRLVLILTVAAAVAMLVKDHLEKALEHWFHLEHVSLVAAKETWPMLTSDEIFVCLCLCVPIGVFNGMAGWCFTQSAWKARKVLLSLARIGNSTSRFRQVYVPQRLHLAIIGIVTGCFGAIAYETTGVNGVWGTTFGAIPEAINSGVTWKEALLLFLMKFLSFVIATAGGGPGGMLVPSLVSGGFLGLTLGLLVGGSHAFCSACAVIGMGSLFSSVMHLPVSGVIIIFELTESRSLILLVVIANFISSNVAARLPAGEHSFAHLMLEHDPVWEKLGKQDFIETDAQERVAADNVGVTKINSMKTLALLECFTSNEQRVSRAFKAWRSVCLEKVCDPSSPKEVLFRSLCEQILRTSADADCVRTAWRAWRIFHRKRQASKTISSHMELGELCNAALEANSDMLSKERFSDEEILLPDDDDDYPSQSSVKPALFSNLRLRYNNFL